MIHLVGSGPGDPGLFTLKGKRLLESADAVVYDRLAPESLLAYAKDAERHYVGKKPGEPSMSQEEINSLLVRLGREDKDVVRLKGGDPYIFGRGGEEAARHPRQPAPRHRRPCRPRQSLARRLDPDAHSC